MGSRRLGIPTRRLAVDHSLSAPLVAVVETKKGIVGRCQVRVFFEPLNGSFRAVNRVFVVHNGKDIAAGFGSTVFGCVGAGGVGVG